jgi:hypothetical protein
MEIRKTKTDPIDSAIIALLSLPAMPDRAARWQPTLWIFVTIEMHFTPSILRLSFLSSQKELPKNN